ncbi:hypothetical protein [Streptomyces nanshensis]|uniref:Uncharacterized protein n=1 Tax=Streptomyces nanshensis TaxID=518642 RepID=A0A1E7LCA9_9ACTN|nr:hypothetical protein [Streptomyces nanshensis]OEV13741.1 hypothetical protein AN218_02075 [Streptomyces nanshensis]
MRISSTYSRHWDIETRQHEILGYDLGEGVSRKTLKYGAIAGAVWWGAWLMLLGFPPRPLVPLFLLPPIALTYYGVRRSPVYWRRTNLLLWAVRWHYLYAGLRPVIGRGRIPAPPSGRRLRARRLAESIPQLRHLPGLTGLFTDEGPDPAESYGPPARLTPRVRLYGPDALMKARKKLRRRRRAAKKAARNAA